MNFMQSPNTGVGRNLSSNTDNIKYALFSDDDTQFGLVATYKEAMQILEDSGFCT